MRKNHRPHAPEATPEVYVHVTVVTSAGSTICLSPASPGIPMFPPMTTYHFFSRSSAADTTAVSLKIRKVASEDPSVANKQKSPSIFRADISIKTCARTTYPRGKKSIRKKFAQKVGGIFPAALTPKREVPETWVIKLALFESRYLFIRVEGMFVTFMMVVGPFPRAHAIYIKRFLP